MIEVKINEREKSYPIFIESTPINELKQEILKSVRGKKFVVVISQKVDKPLASRFVSEMEVDTAVLALDFCNQSCRSVSVTGFDAVKIGAADHPVIIIQFPLDGLPENITDSYRITESIVRNFTFGLTIGNACHFPVSGVFQTGGDNSLAVCIKRGNFHKIIQSIITEKSYRFRFILIGSAAGDQGKFAVLTVFKVNVIARHVPDADHIAGKFVIAVIEDIPSPAVNDFPYFAQISDVVPHEIIYGITFTGKFTCLENSGPGIVIEGSCLIELIGKGYCPRLRRRIGVTELIVRKYSAVGGTIVFNFAVLF